MVYLPQMTDYLSDREDFRLEVPEFYNFGFDVIEQRAQEGGELDKEFVQAIAGRPERLALASSVIGFAHTLDVEVVAEGIETKEDLQALHQLGCDHAQGHLLARPLPAADLPSINLDDVIDLR